MEFTEVTDRLLDLEADLDLLDIEVDGVPVWERVRFDVNRTLLQELGVVGQAHTHADPGYGEALYKLTRNLFVKNPLLAPDADVLVWGHEQSMPLSRTDTASRTIQHTSAGSCVLPKGST